jgi:hypothetical protein
VEAMPGKIPKLAQWRIRILRAIKVQIRELLGPRPAALDRYCKTYKKLFYQPYRRAPLDEVMGETLKHLLIYIADYHTLPAAQEFQLKVLDHLVRHGKPIRLFLEPYAHADQKHLDDLLAGRASEEEFLERIRFKKTWGFEWGNYLRILQFARANGISAAGINLKENASLNERDIFSGNLIAESLEQDPKSVHVVIIGDMHLAPSHLPRQVSRQGRRPVEPLIVCQNSETVYLKELQKDDARDLEAVRLKKNFYCAFNTPPWIKYQTFLLYLLRSTALESSEENLDEMVQLILGKLGEFAGRRWEEEIQVETFSDLGFLPSLLNVEDAHPFFRLLQENYTFYLPRENLLCLPMPDLVRMAEELGHFIFYTEGRWEKGHVFETGFFAQRIFYYAFGYLASKLIQESRRTDSLDDLRRLLRQRTDARAEAKLKRLKKAAPHIEKLYRSIVGGPGWPLPNRLPLWIDEQLTFAVSRRTGYLLGEDWFRLLKDGQLDLRSLLRRIPGPEASPEQVLRALQVQK